MNRNVVMTYGFSSSTSSALYESDFREEPEAYRFYKAGRQCGGCAYYAKFNSDYGLCCHPASRHLTETVFEHFTCRSQVEEGWESHSFADPSLAIQKSEPHGNARNLKKLFRERRKK